MAGLYVLEEDGSQQCTDCADNSVQWIVTPWNAGITICRDAHEEIERSIACSHRGGLPAADLT